MMHDIVFQAPRGDRILRNRFLGVQVEHGDLWWSDQRRAWGEWRGEACSNTAHIRSYKAFRRHLRDHADTLAGKRVMLISRFIGYDIIAEPKGASK
jgi:hypothetical protein